MKTVWVLMLGLAVALTVGSCKAQSAFGSDRLTLVKTIPIPGVRGRIDHLEVNLQEQLLYVAALGNNTLEVIDLRKGKVVHEIQGLDAPQGVAYIPQNREIFVANGGNGECYFYDAHYEKRATLHLASDADDVRYDSLERKIYVGYGEGGIAVVDADSHQQIADLHLPVHPESFQMDRKLNRMYVNLPDANRVDVIDLKTIRIVAQWERNMPRANFPMAIDSDNGCVFVGYRHPARLVVFDAKTGRELFSHAMTADADDLYYDPKTSEVIISGGGGYISIFLQKDPGTYIPIANIATQSGARTSLLIPSLRLLILAVRATSDHPAALRIYKLNPPDLAQPASPNP